MSDLSNLYEVADHTLPAHRKMFHEFWLLSQRRSGGKRVSAATLQDSIDIPDISIAGKGMPELGQDPPFDPRRRKN